MIKRALFFSLAVFMLVCTAQTIFAQRGGKSEVIEVRLASPMPRNSDWGRALDRMAAEWARVTNNEVRLRIIHDGIEGGETKTYSSLSSNTNQASLFTSFGIAKVCPEIMTLSVPFLIGNDKELSMVLDEMLPVFEERINKTNFVVLSWSKGGWVNVFSKNQVLTPEDLRGHKLASNPESGELNMAFRALGFHVVETEGMDLGTRMANNMVTAIYQTPAAVAPLGMHKYMGNMLDIPIAPYIGAIMINRVTWNKLGADRQRKIVDVTRKIAAEFDATMPKTVSNALTMMQRDGLKVNKGQVQIWRNEVDKSMSSLVGTAFDKDIYQQINKILEKSRNGQ